MYSSVKEPLLISIETASVFLSRAAYARETSCLLPLAPGPHVPPCWPRITSEAHSSAVSPALISAASPSVDTTRVTFAAPQLLPGAAVVQQRTKCENVAC